MTLEQLTFRIEIEGEHASTFVHFIDSEKGYFSVKVGDLVMSIGEFREYVRQLKKIDCKLDFIEEFARNVES
jgi:hypothetical protein